MRIELFAILFHICHIRIVCQCQNVNRNKKEENPCQWNGIKIIYNSHQYIIHLCCIVAMLVCLSTLFFIITNICLPFVDEHIETIGGVKHPACPYHPRECAMLDGC